MSVSRIAEAARATTVWKRDFVPDYQLPYDSNFDALRKRLVAHLTDLVVMVRPEHREDATALAMTISADVDAVMVGAVRIAFANGAGVRGLADAMRTRWQHWWSGS